MDIVLVHGTTQSPEGWQPLSAALTARGYRCHTVDLLSGGTERTAAGYAALAATQLDETVDRPVLVAHSGAGLLLPALADALDAARMVWLGAAVPDLAGGRSFTEQVTDDAPAMFTQEWRTLSEAPTVEPVEVDAGHCPHVSAPEAVAELIDRP